MVLIWLICVWAVWKNSAIVKKREKREKVVLFWWRTKLKLWVFGSNCESVAVVTNLCPRFLIQSTWARITSNNLHCSNPQGNVQRSFLTGRWRHTLIGDVQRTEQKQGAGKDCLFGRWVTATLKELNIRGGWRFTSVTCRLISGTSEIRFVVLTAFNNPEKYILN